MSRHKNLLCLFFTLLIIIACDIVCAQIFNLYEKYLQKRAHTQTTNDYETNRLAATSHETYHHDLNPNIDLMRNYGPLEYRQITNSLGFRDSKQYDVPLEVDKSRVVFMGDSFTEGVGFDYEDTFVGLIQKQRSDLDILNAGVSSYSPVIYFAKTKYLINEVGLKFDTLVVFLDISDIYDEGLFYIKDANGKIHSSFKYGKGAIVMEVPPVFPGMKKVEQFLQNNSLLFRSIISIVNHHRGYPAWKSPYFETGLNNPRSSWTFNQGLYDFYGKKGLAKADHYMTRLKRFLDEHNIQLIVAVYPWPDQVFHRDSDSIQSRYWREWAERNQVKFIDYFPYFFEIDNKWSAVRAYFIDKDCHWNKGGHALIADKFLSRFKSVLEYRRK